MYDIKINQLHGWFSIYIYTYIYIYIYKCICYCVECWWFFIGFSPSWFIRWSKHWDLRNLRILMVHKQTWTALQCHSFHDEQMAMQSIACMMEATNPVHDSFTRAVAYTAANMVCRLQILSRAHMGLSKNQISQNHRGLSQSVLFKFAIRWGRRFAQIPKRNSVDCIFQSSPMMSYCSLASLH